jgi:prolipoprotein diacylglyceryltransferase
MRHFAMFLFAILFYTGKQKPDKNLVFGLFVLLFSVRIVVEYVKESQGGFESTLGLLSTGNGLYHLL